MCEVARAAARGVFRTRERRRNRDWDMWCFWGGFMRI